MQPGSNEYTMKKIDYQKVLNEIAQEIENIEDSGEVASYIPELSTVDPDKLGMHLTTIQGDDYFIGDAKERFSIQSISKVLSLALALETVGESVWNRVGIEPSGTAFNSLVQLEYEKGIPRNPMINAGAIVICDILIGLLDDSKLGMLDFVKRITGISGIGYSQKVAESEMRAGYRNRAVANLMKDFGNIHHDVDTVLDLYFHLCSIEMSCEELSKSFLFLASDGISPMTKESIITPRRTKRINSIMQMCGFYDEAGEFAFRTGLPGKSGVGGGIVAIHPGEYSVAVWSPKLNKNGNSYKGMKVLEMLTTKTKSSIF
jgi:glutaminase